MRREGMIVIKSLEQTCSCAPMMYEGFTTDGKWIWIRLRWSGLRVLVSKAPMSKEPEFPFEECDVVYHETIDDEGFTGNIKFKEMVEILKDYVDFSLVEDEFLEE
jgi:hypothetical protein